MQILMCKTSQNKEHCNNLHYYIQQIQGWLRRARPSLAAVVSKASGEVELKVAIEGPVKF